MEQQNFHFRYVQTDYTYKADFATAASPASFRHVGY